MKSWNDVVKQNCNNTLSSKKLKEAVKSAVDEDDRSKNFMIYGAAEEEDENPDGVVSDLLEYLEEKPRVAECYRVGATETDKIRPMKVKLTSPDAVKLILRKTKYLKRDVRYKSTYIAQDRTLKERVEHKLLVDELKNRIKEHANQHHYIRNSKVISVTRITNQAASSAS